MHYISPVTRYVKDQGWAHNNAMSHAHMHYISPAIRYIQNQGCSLNTRELRHIQIHYISPVIRYIENTRGGHIHLFVILTCSWLSNCRKCYTYFNDILVCYCLHWHRRCALLDVTSYSPVDMCRRFGVSVCLYHQGKLKKSGMLMNPFLRLF